MIVHDLYVGLLAILAPSHVGLSMLLSVCSDYGLEHDIKCNTAKRIIIFCCKKFKDIHEPSFELSDNILPRVHQCKYLGHGIADYLKDDNDIARQYKRMYALGNDLIVKLYIMRSRSIKSESIRKLYVAYNNVFRLFNAMNRCIAVLVIYL